MDIVAIMALIQQIMAMFEDCPEKDKMRRCRNFGPLEAWILSRRLIKIGWERPQIREAIAYVKQASFDITDEELEEFLEASPADLY